MPRFAGIDLCATAWRYAFAQTQGPALQVEPCTTVDLHRDHLLQLLAERLRITEATFQLAAERDEDRGLDIIAYAGAFRQRVGVIPSDCVSVGMAVPYACPPPIHRVLPGLLSTDAALRRRLKCEIVAAPVAAALSLLAMPSDSPSAVALPAVLLLCTGAERGAELTAARVSVSGQSVLVQFLAYRHLTLAADAPAIDEQLAGWTEGNAALTEAGRSGLWFAGPELQSASAAVARTLHLPEEVVKDLGPEAVVGGAARYAACCAQHAANAIGRGVSTLRIERISPYALGVIGQLGPAHYYWRRVIPAGQPGGTASGPPRTLRIVPPIDPPILLFAEAVCPTPEPPLWLAREDWGPFHLRVYTSRKAEFDEGPLEITLNEQLLPRLNVARAAGE